MVLEAVDHWNNALAATLLSVWQSIYAKEPIDGTVDGIVELIVAFEL